MAKHKNSRANGKKVSAISSNWRNDVSRKVVGHLTVPKSLSKKYSYKAVRSGVVEIKK